MKAAVAVALMGLVVAAAAVLEAEGRSHSKTSAPAPALGDKNATCMTAVMTNMISCMDYVVAGATENKPDKACCGGAKAMLKEDGAKCFCLALSAAPGLGVDVNVTRAAALPSLCHISHPPSLSKCLATMEVPTAAPPKVASYQNNHISAPAPAPSASSVASVSYGLMAVVTLLSLVFFV